MKGKLILLIISIVFITSCSKDNAEKEVQPKVDFSYEIDLATKTVTFTNKSVAVEKYNWLFTKGETSTEQSPKHTFKSEGTFNVSLSVNLIGSTETLFKAETIVIGDPNGHKPMAIMKDAEDIDFAGFIIRWTRKNPDTEAIFNIQIAHDAQFDNIVKTKRVDGLDKLEFKATSLDINTQYWFRMKIIYKESSKEEIYYSAVKSVSTTDLPTPSFSINNIISTGSFVWLEVIKKDITSYNLSPEGVACIFEVSRSKTFEKGYEAISTNVFNTYIKEPKTTLYFRYRAVYKGVTRVVKGSESYSYNYIASLGNSNGISGNYSKKYVQNGKTMLEFGVEDGAKSVIQIKNFNGVGRYPLKSNTNHSKEEANTINTVDESYAYYLDGKSNFKYFLSREGVSLDVYRETADAYYCTIISEDDYDTLQFRQSRLDVKDGSYYSLISPYFVIMK